MNSSVEISSHQDYQSSSGTTTTTPEGGFPWSEAIDYLCLYGMIMTSIGFVFNFFCYITAGHMPQTNSAHLMRYLAVWDSIRAITDGFLYLGSRYFGKYTPDFSNLICRVLSFHSYGSGFACNYLVVAMAIDRLVAINFPFFHRNYSSKKISNLIGSSCVATCYFISLPMLYFYGHNENKICSMLPKSISALRYDYYGIINSVFYFIIPFLAIGFANIIFIRSLQNRRCGVTRNDALKNDEK